MIFSMLQFVLTTHKNQGNSEKNRFTQEKEFEKSSDFPFITANIAVSVCALSNRISAVFLTSHHKARIFQKFVYYFHEQANMILCMYKDKCQRLKNPCELHIQKHTCGVVRICAMARITLVLFSLC